MSNQEVSTPMELIRAVEARFGKLTIDLAANAENHKAPLYFGPDRGIDSLSVDWCAYLPIQQDTAWLNNPYKNTAEWVKKCYDTVNDPNAGSGWKILQLIPASVCANYWTDYIDEYAYVIKLTPRPFATEVRDCCLVIWQPEQLVGQETWRWKE